MIEQRRAPRNERSRIRHRARRWSFGRLPFNGQVRQERSTSAQKQLDRAIMAASVLGLMVAVWILPAILHRAPEPIAGAAAEFGEGARTTLALTAVSGVLGLLLGVVIGLMRVSPTALLRQLSGFYVWVIRGTPLVVQLLFVYFVVPAVVPALRVSDFASAVIALGLNVAAYNAEILRACLQAIPRGQFDAARSLGLRRSQMMRRVILPQAFRVAVPPLVNNIIGLLKDSSLAYVIGVVELSLVGNRLQAATFRPVPVFVTTAAVYLFMTTFLSFFSAALERRLARES